MPASIAFGIRAAPRAGHGRLGAEVERLGYAELWVNDTRGGDGISTLAEVARGTTAIGLGVGVVALSEHSPAAIVERLARAALPADRLVLGVGAGSSASLELVRAGVSELRARLPGVPIAIAAVGPRMLHLAGEIADAVVATWALPERIPWVREQLERGAATAGRSRPRLVLYLRTALGPGAESRLRREMERYAAFPHYARAFRAQGNRPLGVAIEPDRADDLAPALDAYRSMVDTLVVRALPVDDDVDGWLEVAGAAAEAAGLGAR